MKRWLLSTIFAGAAVAALGMPAQSAPLVADGVSYVLETQATANPLTNRFALVITGENTISDTEGGRTGINAIAFNNPAVNAVSGVMLAPPGGLLFQTGGLNSSGCNGSGNFFCFDNTAIPPIPNTLLTGTLVFVFEVTLGAGGSWANYHPDFKIDWVGTKNNYDLISKPIDVSTVCPDCVINPTTTPVPEPMTIALLGAGLLGAGAARAKSRKEG